MCACRWLKFLIFPMYAFWVPQIVYCARHDVRQPLRPAYVIGITLTRLALPLYLFGCPHNLLGWQPRPGVCLGLCICMAVQVRGFEPRSWVAVEPCQPKQTC